MRKVLYVQHNHASIRPGGVEVVSQQLFDAIREHGRFDPTIVARVGPPDSIDVPHQGTRFSVAEDDSRQYYFHTSADEFDRVLWSARDKRMYTQDWHEFLLTLKPDIVHFRHASRLGYDLIRETRRVLPYAPIVYTLHDFVPICSHAGQMVRTGSFELCHESSPRRCQQCFPKRSTQTFFLRERFVKTAFELVDLFIAPSEFVRRRYLEWGIPPEKIRHEDTGLVLAPPLPDPPDAGRRRRIGFFGRLAPTKGVDVLLESMKLLERDGADVQLLIRGATLELHGLEFQRRIAALLEQTRESVRFTGPYEQYELPALMSAVDWVVVPSIWWEVGPNAIREAMMHRRPAICSDIGSMAERIRDGVNGLHFRVGDPHSLAATIRRAVEQPHLWDEVRGRLGDPHSVSDHAETISGFYDELLARYEAHGAVGGL